MPQNEAQIDDLDDDIIHHVETCQRRIRDVLGLSGMDAYLRYRRGVIEGLDKFGGDFGRRLSNLLFFSDFNNSIKILNVWQKECVEHEMLWRIFEAKEKAKNESL